MLTQIQNNFATSKFHASSQTVFFSVKSVRTRDNFRIFPMLCTYSQYEIISLKKYLEQNQNYLYKDNDTTRELTKRINLYSMMVMLLLNVPWNYLWHYL